jgi:hypothetical protein
MIKKEEHEYPLVKVIWIDITADSNWKSLSELEKESLPVCVSVGYLYSIKNKITRLFADYSLKDGEIDEVGNTTLIPNSVINRPLSQGAIKIYTGSVVRVSGISDNEPPTLVLGPDKFEWQLLDQLLFPASR